MSDPYEMGEPWTPLPAHTWEWCELCGVWMVLCRACGNNTCNGTYGKDGTCSVCPDAYALYLGTAGATG